MTKGELRCQTKTRTQTTMIMLIALGQTFCLRTVLVAVKYCNFPLEPRRLHLCLSCRVYLALNRLRLS
ncbi:hypothetical protein AGR13a_Lc30068 [Agrobacterium genomosp. 13 str. CFBP 6927]|uniref:Transposase n=1 Tax=Agrobacterium genomosp. 13 str. CFBP 6927 TaxID=1183428 RepID=A0ABP2BPT4_9HYPH|nr:hypothetical protein AGR13a_Lc30068 [Agrobacterium genomosp. 13 str. CFBP 6927]